MKIEMVGSTNNMKSLDEMLRYSQICARTCYSEKDFEELQKEKNNPKMIESLLKSGHHSVFEHVNLTFNMNGIPKILAMFFNNEKQYASSEKSARYTKMKDIVPEQKEKYNKWKEILIPSIDKVYPKVKKKREEAIKKLAKENARYMTSVFTPTKMIHTINLRQVNFLIHEFEEFVQEYLTSEDVFKKRIGEYMNEFLNSDKIKNFKVENLKNQTDRKISLFNRETVKDYFGETYSTAYMMSFAGLAQAHRHRTINYHISDGTELCAPLGFFIPDIISDSHDLKKEWLEDLRKIAKDDFPQAQLVVVNERGTKQDFISKTMLRLCGHAQYEIMRNTMETAKKYSEVYPEILNGDKPLCGPKGCKGCNWGNKYGIKRIV